MLVRPHTQQDSELVKWMLLLAIASGIAGAAELRPTVRLRQPVGSFARLLSFRTADLSSRAQISCLYERVRKPLLGMPVMQTATVITNGDSQSVELPNGFHLDGGEVFVKRLGSSVMLIPKDANLWELMAEGIDQFTDDFMIDRAQPAQQEREGFFE